MLEISLYLDRRRETKKGFPVKLTVYDTKTQKQKQISIGEYQNTKHVKMTPDLSRDMQKYHDRLDFCNQYSLNLERAVEVLKNGYDGDSDLEIQLLEGRLKKLKKERLVDFEEFSKEFMEEKQVQGLSIRHYEQAIAQLQYFLGNKRLNINEITYEFLNKFVLYKQKTGKGTGAGINTILRSLRTIYLEAQRRESLGVKQDNPFKGIIKQTRSSKDEEEYWEVKDIKRLFNFEHKQSTSKAAKNNMQKTIDIFLFQFAIGGHDLIDVANLKWDNLKNGRIKFQRFKNRNKPDGGPWINNMIYPYAKNVIEKHGNQETERIFSFFADPLTEKYREQYNYKLKTLKRVSETLGIPRLRTKTPRYLFRTYAGELMVHDLIVMQIMGHKSSNVSHRYQKNLNLEIQDEAHKNILNVLFSDI